MIHERFWRGRLMDPTPAPAGGQDGGVPGLPPPQVGPPAAGGDDPITRLTRAVETQGETLRKLQAQAPPPPPVPGPPAPPDKKAIEKQFWENPLDMVAAISQHAVQTAIQQHGQVGQDTLVETAKQQVRALDPDVWDKFYIEIEAKVSEAVQPQFRGSVNVWKNAFNLVKGEHVSDIVKMKTAKLAAPAAAGDGPAPPSPKAAPAPREEPLTEDQKSIADKLGLSHDEYRRGIENYANQPGKIAASSWDQVITFDSAKKRREARDARRKAAKQPAA